MRLKLKERQAIVSAVLACDPKAGVWLFGSRVDDMQKGGDIDIAVLSGLIGLHEKIRIKQAIYDAMGFQKIDLVVSKRGTEPFFRLAQETGVKLYG
jgi:predicted nucleotidyltransferase